MAYYDRDKFKMELADDMIVGDMSATFKLKKKATFQDGTPVTAKDVKWSLDRAGHGRRVPDLPDEVQARWRSPSSSSWSTIIRSASTSPRKDRLTIPDLAVIVAGDLTTPNW